MIIQEYRKNTLVQKMYYCYDTITFIKGTGRNMTLSPASINNLIEILSLNFKSDEINEIGNLLFGKYDTNTLAGVNSHISLSPRKSAKILVSHCEEKNKIFGLIELIVELDGGILSGRHIAIDGIEGFLNKITAEGLIYNFDKKKITRKTTDPTEMINWGSLKDGKVYSITIMSIDIVENSKKVKRYGIKKMEKIYFQLWQFLKARLKDYDGRLWSWAGDGGIAAFTFKNHITRGVLCALEIQRLIPIFNLKIKTIIPEDIRLRIALDTGKIRFFNDTGRIVSEVINYTAHLEKRGTEAGKISISRNVRDILQEEILELFIPAGVFEERDYFSIPYELDKLRFPVITSEENFERDLA